MWYIAKQPNFMLMFPNSLAIISYDNYMVARLFMLPVAGRANTIGKLPSIKPVVDREKDGAGWARDTQCRQAQRER